LYRTLDSRRALKGSIDSSIILFPRPGGRMHPISRAAVLTLALGSLTLAQDAPDPFLAERILPQNALVFLSIPQSAAASQDYAKSNLAKLVNHPEIRSFTAPLEAWIQKRKTQP